MGFFDFLFGDEDAADSKTEETSSFTSARNIDPEVRKYFQEVLGTGSGLLKQPYQPYVRPSAVKGFTDASGRVAQFSPAQKEAMRGIMGLARPEEFGQAGDLYRQAGAYTPGQFQAPQDYRPDTYATPAAMRSYGASSYAPNQFASGYSPEDFGSTYNPTGIASGYVARDYAAPSAISAFGEARQIAGPQQMERFGAASPFERMAGMERYAGPTGVGEAGVFDAGAAQRYMSPYQQNVTDIAARKAREENARQMMLGQAAAAQMGGGRGGSGEAIMKANLARSLVQDVGDIYGKGQQAAYESAQSQFERDRAARLGYGQVNLGGAQQGYQLNQATQAQNVAQNIAQYNAAEQARQAAYGLNLQGLQQNTAANLNYFNANEAARQAAYGLNLQGQGQAENQRLAAYQAGEGARQVQNAQNLSAYQASQQALQAGAQDRLAAFNATQQARQFGAQNQLAAYQANQQAQQAAEQARQSAYGYDLQAQGQNAAQGLAAFNANQQARQFAAQQNAAQALAAFQANENARQFGATNALAAAQGLGSLGTSIQGADLSRLGAQMDVGAMKTARRQAIAQGYFDADQEAKNWLTNQYKAVAPIMLQTPYNISTMGTSRGTTSNYNYDNSGFLPKAVGTAMQFYTMGSGGGGSGWGF